MADVARWMLAQPHWQRRLVDGVHPDDETYGAIVREVLMPTLAPLVEKALATPAPAPGRALATPGR